MSYNQLYPTYPITLRTLPRSPVRFGSRKVYVDLPAEIYHFMFYLMLGSPKSELTPENVKREWEGFVKNNPKLLHNGRKLASVSLREDAEKPYLRFQVNWQVFFDYLEDLSRKFFEKVSHKGGAIKEFYNALWENYLRILGKTSVIELTVTKISIENFLKLIKSTGDYYAVIAATERLEEFLRKIIKKDEDHYLNAALTNLYLLRSLVNSACVFPCYVLIRNIMENIAKSIVYSKLSKALNVEHLPHVIFFYEYYKYNKWEKINSQEKSKEFIKEFVKKIQKIHNELFEKGLYYEKIINLFLKKNVPVLAIDRNTISNLPQFLGLGHRHINDSCKLLAELYSACGAVIHSSALPFLSLLEFKFFKHFLEEVVENILTLLETVKGLKVEKDREPYREVFRDPKIIRQALRIVDILMIKHRKEIKEIFERALKELEKEGPAGVFIRPKVLLYLLYLISPSGKQIKGMQITYADLLKDVPERLETMSFIIGIKETIISTFHALKDKLLAELEKKKILQLEDEKMRELVGFTSYLNLLQIPIPEMRFILKVRKATKI